ncbi:UNVERIFIED_CONTAM: hypothetical protein FKN15_046049 [Acipenser sinensis]
MASPHTSIPGGVSRANTLDSHSKLPCRNLSSPNRVPEGWWPQTPFSAQQLQYWCTCTLDTWVLATVQDGYTLQFCLGPPPFRGITNTSVLQKEVAALLSLSVDTLAHEWPKAFLYAFPLIPLSKKIRLDEVTVLLVVPRWPRRTWFSTLCQLLHGQPWKIPLHMDLLSQVRGTLWHLELGRFRLWVWRLKETTG